MSLAAHVKALAGIPRRPWAPTLAVGCLAVLLLGGTAWLNPFRAALGSAGSEAPGHLFGLWAVARNLWRSGPLVRIADVGFPEGFQAHLMDPINLAVFLPLYWLGGGGPLGATLGWNALHAAAVGLGAWGCWRLTRRILGDVPALPWASAIVALVFCLSPYVLYVPYMGRTEYLPALLYPLHLSLLHAWLRAPVGLDSAERGPAPSRSVGVWAGLTLGAIALGGWYLAVFAALVEVPLSLWLARGLPWREAGRRLATVALIGLACLLPAAWALVRFPPDQLNALQGSRMGISVTSFPSDPLPALFRISETDGAQRSMDQPGYVGLISLGLAILGALRRRRQAIWPILSLFLIFLSAGPFLVWHPLRPDAPPPQATPFVGYWLMTLLPPLRQMRIWSRVAVLASLPAGVGAGLAYAGVATSWRSSRAALVAVGLMAAMLLDQATYPVVYDPVRPWFDPRPQPQMVAALEQLQQGAVVELPVDLPMWKAGGAEKRGQYLLWHLATGRAVSASPKSYFDSLLASSALVRMAVNRQILSVAVRNGSLDPDAPTSNGIAAPTDTEITCARKDALSLHNEGFGVVLLHRDRAGSSELDELLEAALGDPAYDERPVMAWDLSQVPEPAHGVTCTLPTLPMFINIKVERRSEVQGRH